MPGRFCLVDLQMWIFIISTGDLVGYAPANLLTKIAGRSNPFAVPIAVLIGVPLYSNAAGVIPIVKVLMDKGMAIGTALSFMMAVTALSLPEGINGSASSFRLKRERRSCEYRSNCQKCLYLSGNSLYRRDADPFLHD
jgi:hypothetical protein